MSKHSARIRFYYGWVIVAIGFVSMGLAYSVWYSFSVFFLAVLGEFGWNRAGTSLAFSLFVIVHGLAGPIVGLLCERFGIRRVTSLGAVFLALALAACSVVTDAWQYYLAFGLLTAIGVAAVGVVPFHTAFTRWFVKRRGLVLGMGSAGIGALSLTLLVPLNQYLISTIGWRSAYLALAITVLVVMPPLAFFFLRDRPQDLGLQPDGVATETPPAAERAEAVGAEDGQSRIDRRWMATDWTPRQATRTFRFWGLFSTAVLAGIAVQMVFVHQTPYFVDLGYSELVAASVLSVIGFLSIAGKTIWGLVSDRLGREVTYSIGTGAIALGMVLLIVMPGPPNQWLLYVFAITFTVGYSVHAAVNPATAGDLFAGKHFPVVYGFLNLASNIGSAGGPWLAGYIFDVGGSYWGLEP